LAIEWLDSLESTVRDAVARLDELKEENASLRDRIRHLETEATAAPALPFEDGDRDEEAEALRAQVRTLEERLAAAETEREEVRRRVEGLTGRLATLAKA
jgi:predicted RNase H-like nuclease (RuvC/YqgF family)